MLCIPLILFFGSQSHCFPQSSILILLGALSKTRHGPAAGAQEAMPTRLLTAFFELSR